MGALLAISRPFAKVATAIETDRSRLEKVIFRE